MSEKSEPTKKTLDKSKIILTFLVVILLIISSVLFWQYQKTTGQGNNELESIMSKLDLMIDLPDESPTLATVSDKNKLPDEPFYKKAENGDKVLIFNNASKAILYRPSSGKILEFVTVSIGITPSPENQVTPSQKEATISPVIKLAIFNATQISGLTKTIENEINNNLDIDFTVVKRGDTQDEYKKTLVVDINGKFPSQTREIAKLLNGEVGKYPDSEASIGADIAVFVVR